MCFDEANRGLHVRDGDSEIEDVRCEPVADGEPRYSRMLKRFEKRRDINSAVPANPSAPMDNNCRGKGARSFRNGGVKPQTYSAGTSVLDIHQVLAMSGRDSKSHQNKRKGAGALQE